MSPKCEPGRRRSGLMRRRVPEALLKMSLGGRDDFSIGQGCWPLVIAFSSRRFPSSFATLRSVFACVAVRSVYGLLIFLLPPARDRLSLATSNPFCRFSAIFSHPPRSFTRVCWSSQGKKHKSRRDGGREHRQPHMCLCISMLFLKICFSPLLLLLYVLRHATPMLV